jgi:hypothetical protein
MEREWEVKKEGRKDGEESNLRTVAKRPSMVNILSCTPLNSLGQKRAEVKEEGVRQTEREKKSGWKTNEHKILLEDSLEDLFAFWYEKHHSWV